MSRDGVRNFLRRARKADVSNGNRFRFRDAIGDGDNDDIYRIRLNTRSSLDLRLRGLRGDVDVELYTFDRPRRTVLRRIGRTPFSEIRPSRVNRFLNLEAEESNSGSGRIRIQEELDANDYYLRITPSNPNEETRYRVVARSQELAPTPPGNGTSGDGTSGGDTSGSGTSGDGTSGGDTPGGSTAIPPDGNDSTATAQLLTVDFKQRTFNNNNLPSGFTDQTFYLGGDDTEDYFKFELQTQSVFNLKLSGLDTEALGTDLDVQVLDNLGLAKAQSVAFGTTAEEISAETLAAGTYFIRVFKTPGIEESNYSLTVSALPENSDPNGAGNTPATAADLDLNTLTDGTTFNDFVGGADSNDYYKVVLPTGGGFIGIDVDEIEDDDIDGRTSNLDLQIIPSTSLDGDGNLIPGAPVITSNRSGDNKEEVAGTFDEGTYFIRVFPATEDDGAFYQLNLTAFSILDRPSITLDINPGTASSLTGTTLVGDTSSGTGIIYFFADDGTGDALWQSEGTFDTTVKIGAPANATSFDNLVNVNGDIFFTATVPGVSGNELYVYDGSSINLVSDIASGVNSGIGADPQFTVADGKLYFVANDGINGTELWVTDGTDANTSRISDIATGSDDSDPNQLTFVESGGNKIIYFVASDSSGDKTVYRYDVGAGGTPTQVTGSLADDASPINLTVANGDVYFNAFSSTFSDSLFVISNAATSSSATEVADSTAFGTSNPNYGGFTAFDGTLYFVASDNQNTRGIWRVNSAGSSVEQVAELGGVENLNPDQLTVLTNGSTETLYFVGGTGSDGQELWGITDSNTATAASVTPNLSLGNGATGSYQVTSGLEDLGNLTVVGSGTPTLYFTASTPDTGTELFKVDGALSGITEPFANIRPDDPAASTPVILSSNPSNLVEVGGRLYFRANNNTTNTDGDAIGAGEELWVLGIEAPTP